MRRFKRSRQFVDVVDHRRGALLIGLDRQAEAVPACERGIAERGRDHVERQFQPVGFLGIDGEIQIVGLGAAAPDRSAAAPVRHHALRGSTAS